MNCNDSVGDSKDDQSDAYFRKPEGKFPGKLMRCRSKGAVKPATTVQRLKRTSCLKSKKRQFLRKCPTKCPTHPPHTTLPRSWVATGHLPAPPQGNPECLSAFPHSVHFYSQIFRRRLQKKSSQPEAGRSLVLVLAPVSGWPRLQVLYLYLLLYLSVSICIWIQDCLQ